MPKLIPLRMAQLKVAITVEHDNNEEYQLSSILVITF